MIRTKPTHHPGKTFHDFRHFFFSIAQIGVLKKKGSAAYLKGLVEQHQENRNLIDCPINTHTLRPLSCGSKYLSNWRSSISLAIPANPPIKSGIPKANNPLVYFLSRLNLNPLNVGRRSTNIKIDAQRFAMKMY